MKHAAASCVCGIVTALAAAGARAQAYPAKPVPFVAGGPTDIQERSAAVGAVIIGGTPEQFGDYLKSEIAKFARVVKEAKITAQ